MLKPLYFGILLLATLISFGGGYYLAQQSGYSKVASSLEPLQKDIQLATSGMSQEELQQFVKQVKSYGASINKEKDLMLFYNALQAYTVLKLLNAGQKQEAVNSLHNSLVSFVKEYKSRPLDVGDWKETADTLYQQIKANKHIPRK
jgi:hypothetical protein